MARCRLVTATRLGELEFWAHSYLGRSLRALPEPLRPELVITYENRGTRCRGLPALYNEAIRCSPPDGTLVFVHDDVYLHDPLTMLRIEHALQRFDVVGLAGSRGSDLAQPSWGLRFDTELDGLGWQSGPGLVLSGLVLHAEDSVSPPPIVPSSYGPVPEPCELLDGLFLACRTDRLHETRLGFDETFDFHLYDLDFCRSATEAGLSLGTAAILVTHGSGGAFCTPEWKAAARRYLTKWQAAPAAPDPHTGAPP